LHRMETGFDLHCVARGSAISGILRYGRWSGRTGDN